MSRPLNVLFLAAEADPFVKVGGLGDVAGSLPRALRALPPEVTGEFKLDVRLALPRHAGLRVETRPLGIYSVRRGPLEVQVEAHETTLEGMPVYFLDGEPIQRSGPVYSSNPAEDAEKYAFFSLAALELPRYLDWKPDVIHANDWHTALALYAALARSWTEGVSHPALMLTLHNLPYMGPDVSTLLEAYGLPLAQTDLPEWARVLPLPLGLWASDAIVAVSPTYAQEILYPEFGCGLQDFLRTRQSSLFGILNGLDTTLYNPATDPALSANFTAENLEARQKNKAALQARLGLTVNPDVPLLAIVSRMDAQKGVDLAFHALRRAKDLPWQAVILGTGDPKLEQAAARLQQALPERVRAELRFDGQLARQIYAGADLLLMPSRYEPCGLSQMIAMRYGCLPLVRAVGGLHDTVTDSETGFVFVSASTKDLLAALRRALAVYPDRLRWEKMQKAAMAQDFSWGNSAQQYFKLYQSLLTQ
jgi:starch synthase